MKELDRDLALTPAPDDPGGSEDSSAFDATLSPGWVVGGGVNGGYQLAVVGAAVSRALGGAAQPLAVSAHYLAAATPGPARVRTTVLRQGRSLATVSAELSQGGTRRLSAVATYGDLDELPDGPGDVRTTATPPDLPPLEDCVPNSVAPEELRRVAPLMERFDMRFDPRHVGWTVGDPSGRGELQAWFRFAEEREPDPVSLLLVVDALPPVTFDLGLPGWAPTLALTAHVRARPAPGWLRVRHATRNVAGGLFEEDCEVWDSADRLVAQGRQLARLPRA